MLSLPFPKNVTEVFFRCIVVRRASVSNCSDSLVSTDKSRTKFQRIPQRIPKHGLAEEYMLPMSRVADVSELKINLVNVCGVPEEKLKIYSITNGNIEDTANSTMSFALIEDKHVGPCWQFAQGNKSEGSTNSIATLLAFESTLEPRPEEFKPKDNETMNDMKKASNDNDGQKMVDETLRFYGDDLECRLFDTNPSYLSKAISIVRWPRSASDFSIGLRVDAIDQRNQWFPGTIVDIIDSGAKSNQATTKDSGFYVKVHFDNFSTIWDLSYSLEDFR